MIRGSWRRLRRQYAASFLFFIVLYGSIIAVHGTLPAWLVATVVGLALLKDVADEWLMRRGGEALAYRLVEHNPSNVVLLVLFAAGTVPLPGATLGVPHRVLFPVLAAADLVLDGSQDLRGDRNTF